MNKKGIIAMIAGGVLATGIVIWNIATAVSGSSLEIYPPAGELTESQMMWINSLIDQKLAQSNARIAQLEQRVTELNAEVAGLNTELETVKQSRPEVPQTENVNMPPSLLGLTVDANGNLVITYLGMTSIVPRNGGTPPFADNGFPGIGMPLPTPTLTPTPTLAPMPSPTLTPTPTPMPTTRPTVPPTLTPTPPPSPDPEPTSEPTPPPEPEDPSGEGEGNTGEGPESPAP